MLPFVDVVGSRRRWDWQLILFGLNLVLVPMGYYFGIRFGALGAIKAVRLGLMIVSLAYLALGWREARYPLKLGRHWVLVAFVGVNLAVMPFSVEPAKSLERFLTVLPFWVYIDVFAAYLRGRYGPDDGLRRFLWVLLITYGLPVLIFYAAGDPFSRLSIYGDDSRGFVSNQFGWAAVVTVAVLFDIRRYLTRNLLVRAAWVVGIAACLWLLLISGSRSGYLSLGLSIVVLVLAGRGLGIFPRLLVVGAAIVGTLYMVGAADSALNQRIKKSEAQLETIEPRLVSARQAFHALETHEERFLTGVGFDLYSEGIWIISTFYPRKAHNSYLELFVNTGGIVFGLFLFGLVLPGLVRYIRFDASRFSFVPPLLIIPYFENNLGAGQFLFYPWMFFFFWYLHDTRTGATEAPKPWRLASAPPLHPYTGRQPQPIGPPTPSHGSSV